MRILDRAQSRIPQPWRTIVDWFVTVTVAVAFVLTFQAQIAKPYRIPSPSMEPTLHCAKPVAHCQGRFSDRVVANRLAYRFGEPKRGQIVVFRTPEAARRCGQSDGGSTFVKRIIGSPASSCRNATELSTSTATVSSSRMSTRHCEVTNPTGGRELRRVTTSYSATTGFTPATREPGERCLAAT